MFFFRLDVLFQVNLKKRFQLRFIVRSQSFIVRFIDVEIYGNS